MLASAAIALSRLELDDVSEMPLWSTPQLLAYLWEGQLEASIRADLIWDATSPMCAISVAAGAASVAVDQRITRINFVGWDDGSTVREIGFHDERDTQGSSWRQSTGIPSAVIAEPNALRLYPRPSSAGTLRLEVYRTPLASSIGINDTLEIPDRVAHLLREWVKYRAYGIRDADAQDRSRSAEALQLFEQQFGPRPNVAAQAQRLQRRSPTIRPKGF